MLSNRIYIFKKYLNCSDIGLFLVFALYCFHRKGTSQNPFLTIFITDTVFRKQHLMLSV